MAGKHSSTFKTRLRYKFDNLMSKGPIALIGWLGLLSLLLVATAGIILTISGFSQDDSESLGFIEAAWESLMRTLDPGTMGGDTGWGFRLTMLGVTLGGIFIVSTLIGVLASGISSKLDELRKGHSFVIEKNHTLILGWSEKVFAIISELIIANANQHDPKIVILASRDKVEMEDEINNKIPDLKNTRVICRNGSTIDLYDLEIVNPHDAKSIIILAPVDSEPDISVIKTILALTNSPHRKEEPYHIVAEISDRKNKDVAEMIAGGEVTLIHSEDLISRVIAQTCRQSGLSVVYTELLDFDGAEIYFQEEPKLTGKTFSEILHMYEDSTVIGLRYNDGRIQVNPPMDTVLQNGDNIIAISEDDDTIKVSAKTSYNIDENVFASKSIIPPDKEKTLILGWNVRGCSIIKELDNYVAKDSEVLIVTDDLVIKEGIEHHKKLLNNIKVELRQGHTTDREILESLDLHTFNHIIILCYTENINAEEADSKTLITLLHLRNISERSKTHFSIVSEMLDIRNKELAEVTKADDFIISNKLISLMLSQLSENKELKAVFDDLFDSEGSEIYVKPMSDYVQPGKEVSFHSVAASASRHGEIAIGYRLNKYAHNADKAYGVVVNPVKSNKVVFDNTDKVIVIAED